jgi:cyclopropane fatty-acyl-phospholipid synthase-like methyltransferase
MEFEWYETFFGTLALDFWRAAVTPAATAAEADFIVRELAVAPPARLLDLPTGLGRHALVLAQRGYRVTGVDVSAEAIRSAHDAVLVAGVEASFHLGDMRHPPPGAPFDGAYCFGNSFGYLSHEDMHRFVKHMFAAVVPGGHWVIESGAVAEALLPFLVAERTLEAGGVTYSVRNRHDAVARRLFQSCTLTRGTERTVAEISQAVYTLRELRALLEDAGWRLTKTYGSLDARPFAAGDRRVFLVARRP